MAKVVGEVAIDVTADIGPLVKEMKRGEASMNGLQGASDRLARGLNSLGDKAISLGKGLSVVTAGMTAAGAAAFAMTKSVASAGDTAAKSARGAGVSGEYFQEMAFAMGQVAAISDAELADGMSRVNRLLGEASEGSKSAIAAFEKIGISQKQIASGAVSTEAAFDALVQTLSDAKDPATAAAISYDLLGRAGADLGPKLAGSAGSIAALRDRAQELGIVMSKDALDASEAFGDKLDEVQKGFQGLKVAIANELLPVFVNTLLPAMNEKVIPTLQSVIESVGGVIEWFSMLPGPVQEAAAAIGIALGAGGPILLGIGLVSNALSALIAATGPVGLFIAAASLSFAAWQTWGDDIKAAVGSGIDYISEKFNAFLEILETVKAKAIEIKNAIRDALLPQSQSSGGVFQGGFGAEPDLGQGFGMGKNIADGMISGIGNTISEREGELRDYIDRVPQIARDQLGIESPSRVFQEIGNYVGDGFALGISDSASKVAAAVGQMSDGATDAMYSGVDDMLGAMQTLFQGNAKIGAALAWVSTLIGAAKELEKGVFGLKTAAMIIAKGAAFVSAIKSAKPGTSAGGGGSVSAAGDAPAQMPIEVMVNTYGPGDFIAAADLRGLLTRLNSEAGDLGYRMLLPR